MRKRDHNVLTNAASLLICGLLAGVVVAAAAFPAVAMSGLAAKAGAETFGALPKELTVARSPQISYLLAADGKTPLATMYDENRRDVKLKDIAPMMVGGFIYPFSSFATPLPELQKRLTMYKLRSDVSIADRSGDFSVHALLGGDGAPQAVDGGVVFADPRSARLGARALLPRETAAATLARLGFAEAPFEAYEALRVEVGAADSRREVRLYHRRLESVSLMTRRAALIHRSLQRVTRRTRTVDSRQRDRRR